MIFCLSKPINRVRGCCWEHCVNAHNLCDGINMGSNVLMLVCVHRSAHCNGGSLSLGSAMSLTH